MRDTMTKPKTKLVTCALTMEEVAELDLMASRMNPASPKRSDAVRVLLTAGLEMYVRNRSGQTIPSATALPPRPSLSLDPISQAR